MVSLGAVQLQAVISDRTEAQNIADAAALWGAQQLTVTPVGADQRTEAFADSQLGGMRENATVSVDAAVIGATTMKVTIDTHRPSFFFNLFPTGGFHTHAEAVAEGVSQTPLCVMTFGTNSGDKMEYTNTSQTRAPQCLIHANENVEVAGSALLQANTIETGASASGPMSPAASTGAPDMADPFASFNIPNTGALGCVVGSIFGFTVPNNGTRTLSAGCHGDVIVNNGGTLILAAGEHVFTGKLELKTGANLTGEDVVLAFGENAAPILKDGTTINLSGRRTGWLAGFVMLTTRNRTNEFKLEAQAIDELTGTIYVPSARLYIEGNSRAAEASDWTVMAAKSLKTSGSAQIEIHANYYGSDVPVPTGVGNRSKIQFTALKQ